MTAMTCHGPTRIEDAVAVDARKSHCLCRSTCYCQWYAVLQCSCIRVILASGRRADRAGTGIAATQLLEQNQQTSEGAPQLALNLSRELNCMQDCRIQHVIKHKKSKLNMKNFKTSHHGTHPKYLRIHMMHMTRKWELTAPWRVLIRISETVDELLD